MAFSGFVPIDFSKNSHLADFTSTALTTYYGFYLPKDSGSVDTAQKVFMLAKQVVDASGNITSFKWSSDNYDQTWDSRTSANYY